MKKLTVFLVIVLAIFVFLKLTAKPSPTSLDSEQKVDFILYYSESCPHCKTVEEYIKTEKVDDKLKISQKEVYYNQENSKEFQENISQYCPEIMIDQGISVPVAFDVETKKCYIGSTFIIDFIDQLLVGLSKQELPI